MLARYAEFPARGDDLGWLIAIEGQRDIPFDIRRAYYIFGTRQGVRRGKHAHYQLQQLMICMTGSCKVLLDDGRQREEVLLARNDCGLFIDPMVWHEMYDFSADCVLLVLANGQYDPADYIRDYSVFKTASGNAP